MKAIAPWSIFTAYTLAFRSISLSALSSITCSMRHKTHPSTPFSKMALAASISQEVVINADSVLDSSVCEDIANLIQQRAEARWKGDYSKADEIRISIETIPIPENFRIAVTDTPRGEGGGSSWALMYSIPAILHTSEESSHDERRNVLNLAHSALGMAVSYADRGKTMPIEQLEPLVAQAKNQLRKWSLIDRELRASNTKGRSTISFDRLDDNTTKFHENLSHWTAVETHLSGRKAADAVFWFAVAGTSDSELFELLSSVCVKELKRFGDRPSCRPKDIMTILERLAAAGIRGDDNVDLEIVATRCLSNKGIKLLKPVLSLHSDYCAAMIWNFSTKQRKQRIFLSTAAKRWEVDHNEIDGFPSCELGRKPSWSLLFDDPSRPLVIDVGCGMGLSLLGLSSIEAPINETIPLDWGECNFVGVDLSSLSTNYAKGIAHRWALSGKLAFVVDTADHFLEVAASYPGKVQSILIQFPTPFRQTSFADVDAYCSIAGYGNSQLPKSANEGFMVTQCVLQRAAALLKDSEGELILQSNCEDVAIWMRKAAEQKAGFAAKNASITVTEVSGVPTQRTVNWIASGGQRASGHGWFDCPILPPVGRTETEIACVLNGKPVHRCVLTPS